MHVLWAAHLWCASWAVAGVDLCWKALMCMSTITMSTMPCWWLIGGFRASERVRSSKYVRAAGPVLLCVSQTRLVHAACMGILILLLYLPTACSSRIVTDYQPSCLKVSCWRVIMRQAASHGQCNEAVSCFPILQRRCCKPESSLWSLLKLASMIMGETNCR